MPEFCTCGAQLPPDALFCHKCGKPQRDLVVPENLAPPPPLPEVTAAPPVRMEAPPLNFQNPVAIRIALWVALSATILSLTLLPLVAWPAGGFFAVFLYRRRTGSSLNVNAGARMGMITGVLMAAMSTVLLSLVYLPAALSGKLGDLFQEQLKNSPWHDPSGMQLMMKSMSGSEFAFALFFMLVVVFTVITALSVAGGAIGAKVVGRG